MCDFTIPSSSFSTCCPLSLIDFETFSGSSNYELRSHCDLMAIDVDGFFMVLLTIHRHLLLWITSFVLLFLSYLLFPYWIVGVHILWKQILCQIYGLGISSSILWFPFHFPNLDFCFLFFYLNFFISPIYCFFFLLYSMATHLHIHVCSPLILTFEMQFFIWIKTFFPFHD